MQGSKRRDKGYRRATFAMHHQSGVKEQYLSQQKQRNRVSLEFDGYISDCSDEYCFDERRQRSRMGQSRSKRNSFDFNFPGRLSLDFPQCREFSLGGKTRPMLMPEEKFEKRASDQPVKACATRSRRKAHEVDSFQKEMVMSKPRHSSCSLKPMIKRQHKAVQPAVQQKPTILRKKKEKRSKTVKQSKQWEPAKGWDASQERSKVTLKSTKVTRKVTTQVSPPLKSVSPIAEGDSESESCESEIENSSSYTEEAELKEAERTSDATPNYALGKSDLFQREKSIKWSIPTGGATKQQEPAAFKNRRKDKYGLAEN